MPGWFPGHMAKARRDVYELSRLADVVIEVVDARAPAATANPALQRLTRGKPRLTVLSHADLAAPELTRAWLSHLQAAGQAAAAVDAVRGTGVRDVEAAVARLFQPVLEALTRKGRLPRPARCIVVGIPNVGKSSLLNRLTGRRQARVGAMPGLTRGPQWVRAGDALELLDTPGIVPPRGDGESAFYQAAVGCLAEGSYDAAGVAERLLQVLPQAVPDGLEGLARRRGFLRAGGEPDREKAAAALLKDFRVGKLGRHTLEKPA